MPYLHLTTVTDFLHACTDDKLSIMIMDGAISLYSKGKLNRDALMQHLTNCAGGDAIEALEARAEKLALDSNSTQGDWLWINAVPAGFEKCIQ